MLLSFPQPQVVAKTGHAPFAGSFLSLLFDTVRLTEKTVNRFRAPTKQNRKRNPCQVHSRADFVVQNPFNRFPEAVDSAA